VAARDRVAPAPCNLGAVKADAVGIAYAIERDWLIISGGFHSVSLTDAGQRRVK
jgi:hypothetical protein